MPTIQGMSFFALIVLVTAAFVWLVLPFYGAVLWAVILAILFHPLYSTLEKWLGGKRNLAAALSLLACICIVVIPASLILAALAREAASLYNSITAQEIDVPEMLDQVYAALPSFVTDMLAVFNLGNLPEIQERLTTFVGQATQFIATRLVGIGQDTAQLVISVAVMLYLLFFLFRDGRKLAATIRRASPLSDEHTENILGKFAMVVKATVLGNVFIAIVQGALGGITFWLLGIEGAVFWGVIMGVLSLLPAVGAFLVWSPVAVYLLITGSMARGLILLVVGTLVISMIDNILRPPLVGKGTRMPDYVILISTLGGLVLFGMHGFVVGPLIAALFIAVWSLLADEQAPP